jgi:hypothetical protein
LGICAFLFLDSLLVFFSARFTRVEPPKLGHASEFAAKMAAAAAKAAAKAAAAGKHTTGETSWHDRW